MSDIAQMNLKDLAAAIRRRKVSSVEVTKALLARIEKWQPALNAFARVEAEDALKSAKAADRALAAGKAKGPLHGVPLAHKDMYYSKGKLAECGSKIRKGWIAPATATAVERLEAAGSFRLGAVNMVEFAYGPTGHNVHTGNVLQSVGHDAHHRRLIVRLGRGGLRAARAGRARLRHRRLDPDAGAFLRHHRLQADQRPRQPRQRMPLSFTLDTVGPLAQTAEDCALILVIIAGPDPLDPTTASAPKWDAQGDAKRPAKGMTIGIPKASTSTISKPDVAKAFDDAIATFKKLGVKVVEVDLPDQTLVAAAALIVLAVEAATYHAPWLRTRAGRLRRAGAQPPAERARLQRRRVSRSAALACARAGGAPRSDRQMRRRAGAGVARGRADHRRDRCRRRARNAEAIIQGITRFMRPINYLGLPALVVPAGFGQHGMPIGLQIIGRPFGDEALAALGVAFQGATDFHTKVPKLA